MIVRLEVRSFWEFLFSCVFLMSSISALGCGGSGSAECNGSLCPCSAGGIQAAITEGGGPFTFSCDGPTTVVVNTEFVIDQDVRLDGGGNLTVDGNQASRVFSIEEGVTVELMGMTVANGNAGEDNGGGILSFGDLTLNDSTVSGCTVGGDRDCRLDDFDLLCAEGGGIWSRGTLTLIDSTVSGNSANFGGGIANRGQTLSLTNSTVSDNSATGCLATGNVFCSGGGGIWNSGTLTMMSTALTGNTSDFGGALFDRGTPALSDSTVSGNSAGFDGGGVQSFGTLTIVDCTFEDNDAGQSGGAVSVAAGTLSVDSSTLVGNSAVGAGGGVLIRTDAVADFVNTTVSGNVADSGGGIYGLGDMRLASCTVAGNEAPEGNGIYAPSLSSVREVRNTVVEGDCGGVALVSGGYNVESPGDTCSFDQAGDQTDVTAGELNLGPLGDNGGPTETHALLANSVAIDQIPVADCVDLGGEPLAEDQRGEPRPGSGSSDCDVGAFEAQ